jgi:hypothetical protein
MASVTTAFAATELRINDDQMIFTDTIPFVIRGTSNLPRATVLRISVGGVDSVSTGVDASGSWRVTWTTPLRNGNYQVVVSAINVSAVQLLRVQLPGRLPRQGQRVTPPPAPKELPPIEVPKGEAMTDRWRIAPPPYELNEKPRRPKREVLGKSGATLDPYNQNLLKGDLPIRGNDTFLSLTGISDTLAESRSVPTPANQSGDVAGRIGFFGKNEQNLYQQTIIVSADLYQGNTAFQPIRQRLKATVAANINHLQVLENAIVRPDVRHGTRRTDTQISLQELFYERKLRDLSPAYDFVSFRIGSQPFTSDFRGLVFSDTNLGARLFGNARSNRVQYNVALFDRFEKDTNSGLNIIDKFRDQQVAVANVYIQDFGTNGYTQEFSIHGLRDGPSTHYDRNGVLVRPAPVGVLQPHRVEAIYVGEAGLGHVGRLNVDQALYWVVGRDSLNPIAGPDPELGRRDGIRVSAGMAALELSYDRDWLRPRVAFLYATGDDSPRDRNGRGFDSIFESQSFAGGGFSFFNRLGIRLGGSSIGLVERGSLLPSLRSSKEEGQPNYVNPGIQIASAGFDADLTPRLKTIFTANYLRFDKTETLEAILFQEGIRQELGTDLSLGFAWRPYLNNNVIILLGGAAFLPGRGFTDIYEKDDTLFHLFTNLTLTF